MTDDPIGKLAADARERPLLYAGVAAAGLAGVAAAVALSSRAAPASSSSSAGALLRAARAALEEAGGEASEVAEEASESLKDLVERVRRASAGDARGGGAGRAEGRRDETGPGDIGGGIGGGTAAVFAGTLLSKAFTGWMRLQAEERARTQGEARGAALAAGRVRAGGGAPKAIDPADDGFDLEAHLESLGVAELRALASEHEIEGRSSMNKDELVRALCGAD